MTSLRVNGDGAVIDDVRTEMRRAREKHGTHSLDGDAMTDVLRLSALIEEVGEAARAMTYDRDHAESLYKELIQVASIALTWATIVPSD